MVELKKEIKLNTKVYGLASNGKHVIEGYYAGKDDIKYHYMKHHNNYICRIEPSGLHLTIKDAYDELDKRAVIKQKEAEETHKAKKKSPKKKVNVRTVEPKKETVISKLLNLSKKDK